MKTITLVTGNPNKLREIQQLSPVSIKLQARSFDLPEIQSLNMREIIEDKVKRAYGLVKAPVMVEDVSAGLDDLAGLPGPFYKFFREELDDIILVKLAEISKTNKLTIRCLAAYYDGQKLLVGEGVIRGRAVSPRGQNGFGFGPVVLPDGHSRTMAEMTAEEKNAISHRGRAFRDLFRQL